MAIKVFHAGQAGAPSLQGQNGSLITVLDAILVNGYNTVSVSSITRSGSTATVTTAANHGFSTGDSATIMGAAQTDYNIDAVVAGEDATRTQILLYSLVLVPIAVSPWFLGFAGITYGIASAVLGAGFLGLALQVYRLRTGEAARKAAVRLFSYSILYLFLLFALLLGESLVTRMI